MWEEPLGSVRVVHRRLSQDPTGDEEGQDYACSGDHADWEVVDEKGEPIIAIITNKPK